MIRIIITKTNPKFIEAVKKEMEAKKKRFEQYFLQISMIKNANIKKD